MGVVVLKAASPALHGRGSALGFWKHPSPASLPAPIPFRSLPLTVRASGAFLYRPPCPSAVPGSSRASRDALGAGLTLGARRRLLPVSCWRLCGAAEAERGPADEGRVEQEQEEEEEEVPLPGARGSRGGRAGPGAAAPPGSAPLPAGGDPPSFGLALWSEGRGSRVGPELGPQ